MNLYIILQVYMKVCIVMGKYFFEDFGIKFSFGKFLNVVIMEVKYQKYFYWVK